MGQHHHLILVFSHFDVGIGNVLGVLDRGGKDSRPCSWRFVSECFFVARVHTVDRHLGHTQGLNNVGFESHLAEHLLFILVVLLVLLNDVNVVVVEIRLINILNRLLLLVEHFF